MDKKFLFSVGLALVSVYVFQNYFTKREETTKPGVVSVSQAPATAGGVVKVPTKQELHRPLNVGVAFADKKISGSEQMTTVETDFVTASLSNFGGVLKHIDFKMYVGKNKLPLRTVYSAGSYDDEQRKKACFLLALNDNKTPYVYRMTGRRSEKNKEIVQYQTESNGWIIRKTYAFDKDTYKLDVSLDFEPQSSKSHAIRPRLFFVSPFVHELGNDTITPFMFNESTNALEKSSIDKTDGLAWYWNTDKVIFGTEDRYFTHTLISDPLKFTQRAYFKTIDQKNVMPILEGPEITKKQQWTMSFYMGPKSHEHLTAVDERLSDILSFGWLSWFCKFILMLLSFIYNHVQNFGLAIILLTILLRLPFVPLSIYSRRKMELYQKHQPHINRIRMKYKKDMKLQQQEVMLYHKDHNLSPATPVMGCLPLLIQMPILFSLYRVLGSYVDLYQAPFLGWIVDLSAKDPYYILPVLMGVSMILMQSMTPSTGDEKQKVMMWFMSIVMTVLFAGFPAGLVLYWLMNNMLTVAEDVARKMFFSL